MGYNLAIRNGVATMARKAKSTTTTKRAFGYVRVSTTRQADEGVSLSAQQAQIETVARANGWELAAIFVEEGVSGSVPFGDRPQGAALWASLRTGDLVIACKADRAFRNSADAEMTLTALHKRGVDLVLCDLGLKPIGEDATSQLVFGMMGQIAKFERLRISERISEAKQHQKAAGAYLGGIVPFGARVVGEGKERRLAPNVALRDYVLDLHAKGTPSRAIANFVKLDFGVPTTSKTICRFLRKHA